MPDITMCVNKQCPLRGKCYRYRAVPDDWQSYTKFEPQERIGSPAYAADCYDFWEIDGRHVVSIEDADKRNSVSEERIR